MASEDGVIYEPNELCSTGLSIGVGVQGVLLALAPTVLTMALFTQAAGLEDDYAAWSVLAAVFISGIVTVLQAGRLGPIGGGHILIAGSATSFVGIAIMAVDQAGPETLATLVFLSACFQFALSRWLPRLHRIITPTVSGVVLMLIAVGVMQIAVGKLELDPDGAPDYAEPLVVVVTLAVAVALSLRATRLLRLWSPLIGVLIGSVVAALFGLYRGRGVGDASWVGLPDPEFPGFDFSPNAEFWSLLPMFLIVSISGLIKTTGGSVVVQRVSTREPKLPDYRLVQGAVNANGVGSVMAGFAGTLPIGAFDATSASLVDFTRVASRQVGYAIGIMLVALTLLPKTMELLLTVPGSVTTAYLLLIMGQLFVAGMRTVIQDGLQPHKGLTVAVSLAIGIGLQGENIVADLLGDTWGPLFGNGLTVGTITAILMTSFIELSGRRRMRLKVELDMDALPEIDAFLQEVAASIGWNRGSANRLRLVGEEVLTSLVEAKEGDSQSRLAIAARPSTTMVDLQFITSLEEANIEDELVYLSERAEAQEERLVSLRLLQHFASVVRHRKYSGIDIVTVEVEGSRS